MKNSINIRQIILDFMKSYPKEFLMLFLCLLIEGIIASLSMLSVVPMADYLVDSNLNNPSKITLYVIEFYKKLNLSISFWSLGALFVTFNLCKGLLEVAVRYSILKIKYTVVYGLFDQAIDTFFNAKWSFFSNSDNGTLLNTLNKELNTIGDTLGHVATLLAKAIQFLILISVPLFINAQLIINTILMSLVLGIPCW